MNDKIKQIYITLCLRRGTITSNGTQTLSSASREEIVKKEIISHQTKC